MPTTDEIRAAMEWAEACSPRDIEQDPLTADAAFAKLAFAVRELYEAAQDGLSPLAEYKNQASETVRRYRAALEGDPRVEDDEHTEGRRGMTRYKQTRHGWMEPDDEHGGWVLLSDALAAITEAKRAERGRIEKITMWRGAEAANFGIEWRADTFFEIAATIRALPEEEGGEI